MLSNPDCAKFAQALLKQLGDSYSDDPIKLFNKVRDQGGFYPLPFPPFGEARGTVGAGKPASIGINMPMLGVQNPIARNDLARLLFHELVHPATNSIYGYSHLQMAHAAYAVAIAQGYSGFSEPPEFGSDDYDSRSSKYFDARVFAACNSINGGKKK